MRTCLFLVIIKDTVFNKSDEVKTKLRVIHDQVVTGHHRECLLKDITSHTTQMSYQPETSNNIDVIMLLVHLVKPLSQDTSII